MVGVPGHGKIIKNASPKDQAAVSFARQQNETFGDGQEKLKFCGVAKALIRKATRFGDQPCVRTKKQSHFVRKSDVKVANRKGNDGRWH